MSRRKKRKNPQSLPQESGPQASFWPSHGRGEHRPGDWQRNIECTRKAVDAFSAVYACVSILANDVAKLGINVWQIAADGSRTLATNDPMTRVFRRPNHYQTKTDFFIYLVSSYLLAGNAYIFIERDARNAVTALYPLNPSRVFPHVAPDGQVFYQISRDELAPVEKAPMIPARFIVHHRLMTGGHPLIGISPLAAASASAGLGREIQAQSAQFFGNQSRPSGVLKTPRALNPETAKRLKDRWQDLYSGGGLGSVAILEEGLQWEALTMTAADAQLVAQLEYAVKDVARVFHVPLHMLGELGGVTYKNAETLSQIYYKGPLSTHLQALEDRFNADFDMLPYGRRIEFDIHGLLRAEFDVRMQAYKEAIQGGVMTPNEARKLENLGPKEGGDSLYMQQQNMPLESRTAGAIQQAALAYLPSADAIRAAADELREAIRAAA